jgi:WD40 repeat protein
MSTCGERSHHGLALRDEKTLHLLQQLDLKTQETPILTLFTDKEEVTDASWCPAQSTLLACTTTGGQIQLWDLAVSTLRPVDSHKLTTAPAPEASPPQEGPADEAEARISRDCVSFSKTAPVIAVGDSRGTVSLFRLWDFDSEAPAADQSAALMSALQVVSDGLKHSPPVDPGLQPHVKP